MSVPDSNDHLVETSDGSYSQNQGGSTVPGEISVTETKDTTGSHCVAASFTSLLRSMAVVGLFHNLHMLEKKPQHIIWHKIHKWYCLLIIGLFGINIIQFVPSFWLSKGIIGKDYIVLIIPFAWFIQCTANALILFRSCSSHHSVKEITKFQKQNLHHVPEKYIKKSKHLVVVVTTIAWLFTLLNILAVNWACFWASPSIQAQMAALLHPYSNFIVYKIVSLCLHILTTPAWIFPISYYYILSNVPQMWFSVLNDRISKQIEDSGMHFPPEFEESRKCHDKVCHLVDVINKDFKYLIAVSYFTNLPISMLLIQELIIKELSPMTALYIFWAIINTLNVVVLTMGAASLHERVSCYYY